MERVGNEIRFVADGAKEIHRRAWEPETLVIKNGLLFLNGGKKQKDPLPSCIWSVKCEVAQPCLQLLPLPNFQVSPVWLGMTVWASTTPALFVCLFVSSWMAAGHI